MKSDKKIVCVRCKQPQKMTYMFEGQQFCGKCHYEVREAATKVEKFKLILKYDSLQEFSILNYELTEDKMIDTVHNEFGVTAYLLLKETNYGSYKKVRI